MESGDIREEDIIAAQKQERKEKRKKEKQTKKDQETSSRTSKNNKSYNVSATPSNLKKKNKELSEPTGEDRTTGHAKKTTSIITTNLNILCVIYSFDKYFRWLILIQCWM